MGTIATTLFLVCEEAESGPQLPTLIPTPTATATEIVTLTPEITQSPAPVPTEASTPISTEAPTPAPTVYEQLTETIASSALSPEQKQEAQAILAELSQIENIRSQFMNEYSQNLDGQGQPLLLSLIKEKYKSIPTAEFPGYDPNNPNAAYENQIFFIRDENAWNNQTKPVLETLKSEQSAEIILSRLQELHNLNEDQKIYLESNSRSGTDIKTNITFTPQTPQDQDYLQKTLDHIEELKQKMPLFGNYEINITDRTTSSGGYYPEENLIRIYIAYEKPNPDPIKNPFNDQSQHEMGHQLIIQTFPQITVGDNEIREVKNEIRFIRYFKPETVVQLMVNEQKIMTDQQVGAFYASRYTGNYPEPTNPADVYNKAQLSPEDLAYIARRQANVAYDNWRQNPLLQRLQAADIEYEAQLFATYYEKRGVIVSDPAIDKLDFHNQLLRQD